MNPDRFSNVRLKAATRATMTIIDAIQKLPPEEQLLGLASTFLLIAERQGMAAQDVFSVTTNVMNHADGRRPEFAAVADYIRNEL